MENNRKIKFKTFDNQISEMTVCTNISIPELKKMIQEKKKIPIEAQRLIFKGKLMIDNKLLSDYITQDNEIIHLMCKTLDQTSNSSQTQQQLPQQQQTNYNGAPMFSLLGNMLNPSNIMQMTNMIFGENGQNNTAPSQSIDQPSSNNNQNQINQPQQQESTQQTTHFQSGSTNQPQTEVIPSSSEQPSIILNCLSQYPITISESDARYNNFLKDINQSLDSLLKNINLNTNDYQLPFLPLLDTTQNILTAISRTLRYYYLSMYQFLPLLGRLVDLLEREQFITNQEERKKYNELMKKCAKAFENIGKSSSNLNNLLKETNFGNAPNTGFVNVTSRNSRNSNNESQRSIGNEQTQLPSQDNIFGNLMTQLLRPENLSNIVGMVQNMSGNPNGNNNPNQTQSGNFLGNVITNLMNSIDNEIDNDGLQPESNNTRQTQPQSQLDQPLQQIHQQQQVQTNLSDQLNKKETPKEMLIRITNDSSLKETTHLDEILNLLKSNPHQDFALFTTEIVSHLTFKEISDLREMNISGFKRQRKKIYELVASFDKITLISKLTGLIQERIILVENEIDKLKQIQNYEIEDVLSNHFGKIVDILLNSSISLEKWTIVVKEAIFLFVKAIFHLFSEQYQTGPEGALFCFALNLEGILSEIVGKEIINAFKAVDSDSILNVIEHLIDLSFNYKEINEVEKIKGTEIIKCDNEKKIEIKEEIKELVYQKEKEQIPLELNHIQTNTITIDLEEIFNVAMKDKNRLADYSQETSKFSELYYRTSLFQE